MAYVPVERLTRRPVADHDEVPGLSEANTRRGMRSGEFGLVDAKVAALAILGMCNWTAWWYQPGGRRSREEIASMLADFAVKALEQEGKKRPRDAGVGESLRLLRKELAYLEQRIGDEPT